MREWIKSRIPSEGKLKAQRGLRWLGPLLRRPWLWQLTRRRVAAGVGIGVFFGFIIPVLQIAGASVFAIALRANLPVAAVCTLVSNPFTYAPIGVLAYQTGAHILGVKVKPEIRQALIDQQQDNPSIDSPRWFDKAKAIGKPLFLGLAIFAVVGGVLSWALVNLAWTLAVRLKRRRRLAPRSGAD